MVRIATFLMLSAALLMGPDAASWAGDLRCSVCNKKITGGYLKSSDGRIFCSQACIRKLLPKCAVCGRAISGKHYTHGNKRYCSEKCYSTVLPKCEMCGAPMKGWTDIRGHRFCSRCAKRPRCGECLLPVNRAKKYEDGRYICETCSKHVVLDSKKVEKYFLRARDELKKLTGMQTNAVPQLNLVGQKKILEIVKGQLKQTPKGVLRGFYHRTETFLESDPDKPVSVKKKIYMLYGMKANNYVVTGVHEFTHDLIAECFSKIGDAPLWVQEGICQYTASVVCLHYKLDNYYQAIEKHPGPAYGDGFRYFQRTFGKDNWKDLKAWMENVDVGKLPTAAPKAQ